MLDKVWLSIDDQVDLLTNRGLKITDKQEAKDFFKNNNYFRVSGYTLTMRKNDVFHNTCMQDVIETYTFDRKLRALIMELLEDVEVTFKTLISYIHSKNYGPLGYENSDNFEDLSEYAQMINKIIGMKKTYENNQEIFLKHYVEDLDGKLPFWAAVELLNFTDISKLFKAMKVVDKKEIIDYYYNSHKASYYLFVENWLRCSSVLRNIVAHRGRLYNRSFTIKPRLDKKDKSLLLVNSSGNVILDKLFSQVLALQNLCPKKNMWLDFCYDLFVLTETYPRVNIKAYGFPDDWKEKLEGRV